MAQPNYVKLFGQDEAEFFRAHRQLHETIQRLDKDGTRPPLNHPRVLHLAQYVFEQTPPDMPYSTPGEIIAEVVAIDFTTFRCPDAL